MCQNKLQEKGAQDVLNLDRTQFEPYPFKRQSHKMVTHTQTIRQIADEFFERV